MIIVERDEAWTPSPFGSSVPPKYWPGNVWEFDADSWEEYKESEYGGKELHIFKGNKIVATFKPSYWHRVYFKESLVAESA